jgi:two-component system sensor histidine kinase BaeS
MRVPRFPPRGLRTKLYFSHFLVALVGTLTLFTAIFLAAPIIFGNLLRETVDSVARAFGQTLLFSVLGAGLVATVVAAAASLFVSRRIIDPVQNMLAATRRIASGRYGERVPVRENDELGALSESFNSMAASLEEIEGRRMDAISDVSHELRTPLSTLQGYVEGLSEGVVEPSEETWDLLREETGRMRRLIDDLRQLSEAEAGRLAMHKVPIATGEILRLATERMLPLFEEKGVELAGAATQDLPPVLADADRAVQVVTNLLSNALRHTPQGGRVTVGAEAGDGEITFEVEDTGEGIEPEHLPHLFERFYRVERSRSRSEARGGSGVGLAISRALVEAMDGRIWAESPGPNEGAAFSFTLPVSPPQILIES